MALFKFTKCVALDLHFGFDFIALFVRQVEDIAKYRRPTALAYNYSSVIHVYR